MVKDVVKKEPSFTIDENIVCLGPYGKQYKEFSKGKNTIPYDPTISPLGFYYQSIKPLI